MKPRAMFKVLVVSALLFTEVLSAPVAEQAAPAINDQAGEDSNPQAAVPSEQPPAQSDVVQEGAQNSPEESLAASEQSQPVPEAPEVKGLTLEQPQEPEPASPNTGEPEPVPEGSGEFGQADPGADGSAPNAGGPTEPQLGSEAQEEPQPIARSAGEAEPTSVGPQEPEAAPGTPVQTEQPVTNAAESAPAPDGDVEPDSELPPDARSIPAGEVGSEFADKPVGNFPQGHAAVGPVSGVLTGGPVPGAVVPAAAGAIPAAGAALPVPVVPVAGTVPVAAGGTGVVHEEHAQKEGSEQEHFQSSEQAGAQGSGSFAQGAEAKGVQGFSHQEGFRKTSGFENENSNQWGSGSFQGSAGHAQESSGEEQSYGVQAHNKNYGVHGNPNALNALNYGFVP